jgi:hypothetical protein
MGAVPNLFEFVISSELERAEATAQSIAVALASSELFLRAVRLGIEDAKKFEDDKALETNETKAKCVRFRIGKAFSAPTAEGMFDRDAAA